MRLSRLVKLLAGNDCVLTLCLFLLRMPYGVNAFFTGFALQQVSYALGGQMGKGHSFVVGLSPTAPTRPAHPQASCPADYSRCDVTALGKADANPNIITGAVVAGPDGSDGYADDRSSEQSKVSPALNIPYAAAVAGLLQYGVGGTQCQREQGLYQTTFLSHTPN